MTIAKQSLLEAAKAALNQYGKDKSYLSVDIDGDVIQALRQAVQEAESAVLKPHIMSQQYNDEVAFVEHDLCTPKVYQPMTDDEIIDISDCAESNAFRMSSYVTETGYEGYRAIERATIERLGLRWPE